MEVSSVARGTDGVVCRPAGSSCEIGTDSMAPNCSLTGFKFVSDGGGACEDGERPAAAEATRGRECGDAVASAECNAFDLVGLMWVSGVDAMLENSPD